MVLTPIESREHLLLYVENALNKIRNMGIKVRYLLFDEGFLISLPGFLEEQGYTYAVRFMSNDVAKEMGLRNGDISMYLCATPFKVVRVDHRKTGKSCLFVDQRGCRPKRILGRHERRGALRRLRESTASSLPRPHRMTAQ